MLNLRCALYARYSSDQQSPASIADQLRMCRQYADQKGWTVLDSQVYTDEALSGVGADRPGLKSLLDAALSPSRPFEVVLVDDTSRISRRMADSLAIYERLKFAGVRIVAVSQGIDTTNEQADVLVTVHGLVDALYVKELAKKTHRGLEGQALRGLHTGGRCFGYDNVRRADGVELRINEAEAAVVRRIFTMCADGMSLKTIAKTLNAERVASPRPRAGKAYATWCLTAIHAMLRRELYRGRVIWNKTHFVKVPGTNKRAKRPRPQNEWRTMDRPELRIVPEELWERVQARLAWVKRQYGRDTRPGLTSRAASSPFLLSGFLRCGTCGASMVIVTGRGKGGHLRYGCPQNFYRGACANGLKERQDWLEDRLLAQLQAEVLKPQAIDYCIDEFGRQLVGELEKTSAELTRMRDRKRDLEAEVERLVSAVAASGHSSFLLNAIAEREQELRQITSRLLEKPGDSIECRLQDMRAFVTERLTSLRELLACDVAKARTELGKHLETIRLVPRSAGKKENYVAEGEWNLLGTTLTGENQRVRLVAGGGFEPPTFGL